MIIKVIILSIGIIAFILNLIREIVVYNSIKSNFYCPNCNEFNEEISRIGKCKKCHRTLKIKGNSWDHLILHRVNWIPTNSKSEVFKWREYRKLSLIEIALSILAIIIISISLLITIIN